MSSRYHNKPNRNEGKDNPFVGTQYAALWENNPYADMYYDSTFWDDIGLSSKANDQNAEYERLYNEYIAGLYDQQRQDEYNSESAIAERMRSAGQNPDLLGTSGGSQTGDLTPPSAGPQTALNGQSPAITSISLIGQILGFATSSFQQINSIYGGILDNIAKDDTMFSSMVPRARQSIVNEYSKRFSGKSETPFEDVKQLDKGSFINKRQQRIYGRAFDYVLRSTSFDSASQAYKNLNDAEKASLTVVKGIASLEIEAQKHGLTAAAALSKFNQDYYSNLDGETKAEGENRSNENIGWLDKWRNEYYEQLYNEVKKGSWLSGLVLIGSAQTIPIGATWANKIANIFDDLFGKNK